MFFFKSYLVREVIVKNVEKIPLSHPVSPYCKVEREKDEDITFLSS